MESPEDINNNGSGGSGSWTPSLIIVGLFVLKWLISSPSNTAVKIRRFAQMKVSFNQVVYVVPLKWKLQWHYLLHLEFHSILYVSLKLTYIIWICYDIMFNSNLKTIHLSSTVCPNPLPFIFIVCQNPFFYFRNYNLKRNLDIEMKLNIKWEQVMERIKNINDKVDGWRSTTIGSKWS